MSRSIVVFCMLFVVTACGPSSNVPTRPPLAQKWLDRAELGYKNGDFDDARQSVDEVLRLAGPSNDLIGQKIG